MLVNLLETSLYFSYNFFKYLSVKLQLYFYMYVLIVTGSGLMKVNKLMLVASASVDPSRCTPCMCNITWVIISA